MNKVLFVAALAIGAGITFVDSRPNWDDAGVTAAAIVVSAGILGAAGPSRPWLWRWPSGCGFRCRASRSTATMDRFCACIRLCWGIRGYGLSPRDLATDEPRIPLECQFDGGSTPSAPRSRIGSVPALRPDGRDGLAMSPAAQQLLQAALTLPEEERLHLADALLASQDHAGELPFDPDLLVEINRRSAEIDSGTVQTTRWTVVRERVRRRLGTN